MFLERAYTTDELIKKCKAGERKAQEMLYKQFASKMLGVCLRYATGRMEAEDMLQNGFIKVFNKIGDYRFDGSFEGWIRRIMVHTSIEHYRKHHKMVLSPIDEVYEQANDDHLPTSKLAAEELMALIQQLPAGYRIVFNLYAIEGYSHKEIAAIAGISEGTSKSQLSRARSILKEQIIKEQEKKYGYAG